MQKKAKTSLDVATRGQRKRIIRDQYTDPYTEYTNVH